jgi:hypothetical protein
MLEACFRLHCGLLCGDVGCCVARVRSRRLWWVVITYKYVLCWLELAGRNVDGAAWRETWSERLMYASNNLDTVVERNAHKWAADPSVSVDSCECCMAGVAACMGFQQQTSYLAHPHHKLRDSGRCQYWCHASGLLCAAVPCCAVVCRVMSGRRSGASTTTTAARWLSMLTSGAKQVRGYTGDFWTVCWHAESVGEC